VIRERHNIVDDLQTMGGSNPVHFDREFSIAEPKYRPSVSWLPTSEGKRQFMPKEGKNLDRYRLQASGSSLEADGSIFATRMGFAATIP
jgi:hypothetical protein